MIDFILNMTIYQLISYSLLSWVVFCAITFIFSYLGGKTGMFLGHIVLAVLIAFLDLKYLKTHEHMDIDPVFEMGLLFRILLINTCLLPLSFYGNRLKKNNLKVFSGDMPEQHG